MKKVVIIGSGNVAESLVKALWTAGNPPVQVFARDANKAARAAALCGCPHTNKPEELKPADIYIVAVSDKAIGEVAERLDFGDAVVAHTAGSVGLDAFPARIGNRAVIYPLQTFTAGRHVDFREVPILIEAGNERSLEVVREIARTLSARVRVVPAPKRMMIHTAAVFACNFTNHMYSLAEELAAEAGEDFSILKPLIRETTAKALDARSPREAQTGPAARGDSATVDRHVAILAHRPRFQNIYTDITKSIWETSKKTSR